MPVTPRGDARESPLRVRLSDERKAALVELVKKYFDEHFDEDISAFRAEALIDFFVRELGPPVYNQGVRDACAYMQGKLTDVEGEVYEPEAPARG